MSIKAINYWILKKLVDKFPNDKDLGKELRKYINSL